MASEALKIVGRVIDRGSQVGVPNARVQAWDGRQAFKDVIGQAVTDHDGAFRMAFDQSFFDAVIPTASPELFFKILVADRLLASTEKDIVWTPEYGDREVVIGVDAGAYVVRFAPTLVPASGGSAGDKEHRDLKVTLEHGKSRNDTLGDAGLAVRIDGPERFTPAILRLPFDPRQLAGIEPASAKVFRWDESTRELTCIWTSGINIAMRFAWAQVTRPGVYVLIGLPRDRLVQECVRTMARERRVADAPTPREQADITQRALAPLMEGDEEKIEELRQFLMRLELQTGVAEYIPGEVKQGMGGHFVSFPLPHDDTLQNFRQRIKALETRRQGLPEEQLLYPPDLVRNGEPPWARGREFAWWDGIDHKYIDRLDPFIKIKIKICQIIPWICSKDWWMYQHDEHHTGHASGASDIRSTNVGTLIRQSIVPVDGPVVTKPSIVGGKVYVGSGRQYGGGGTLYKIDLATGVKEGELSTTGFAYYSWVSGIGGSPAVVGNRVYFTGVHGVVYCIDATTMTPGSPHPAPIWSTDLSASNQVKNQPVNNPDADCWSGPLVVNDRVYIGCGEGESATTYGFVFCLDANDGHVIWLFCTSKFSAGVDNNPNTIPTAVAAPWAAGAGFTVAANPLETGSAVWSSCAYDKKLDRIYVGTGNSEYPHTAQPDELYGSGLLSLNATTGAFKGFFQPTATDSYWPGDIDIDVPGSPTVFTRNGQRCVAFGSKNGSFFVLDADTLQVLARRQLLPRANGSGVPGDMGTAIPSVVPTGGTGENMYGVMATPAVDDGAGRLFVGVGGYNGMAPDTVGIDATRTPFMRVMNWQTLADAWATTVGSDGVARYTVPRPPMYSSTEAGLSSPALVNDVVFVSTSKAGLYALHASNGTCLWSATGLPSGAFALGPAIYGNYVVLGVGSNVYIYKLPPAWLLPFKDYLEYVRWWPPIPPDPWQPIPIPGPGPIGERR